MRISGGGAILVDARRVAGLRGPIGGRACTLWDPKRASLRRLYSAARAL